MSARLCEREKQWNCPANYLPEKSNRNAYRVRKKIDACENAAKAGPKPRRPQSPTPQVAANPFTHKILHKFRRAIASFLVRNDPWIARLQRGANKRSGLI